MLSLSGQVCQWKFSGNSRTFAEVVIPYRDAEQYIVPTVFDAMSGKGEQRQQTELHAKNIAKAIENGTYTPTPMAANLKRHHIPAIQNGVFHLEIELDKPLAQTDGGHRGAAIRLLIDRRRSELESAGEERAAELRAEIKELENLPIAVTLYFDGDSQQDFLNLQMGKAVDKAHEFSLSLRKDKSDVSYLHAFEAAKFLGRQKDSPFHNLVRMDSKATAGYPISTFCAKGSSDLATSLVGIAKVANKKKATFTAMAVIKAYEALEAKAPHLLEANKPLSSVSNSGTRGSATMLLGLATCLVYRMVHLGHDLPHPTDLEKLVQAANKTLNVSTEKNLSVGVKRRLIGLFAREYFNDLNIEKHEGVPVDLVRTLSASTFSLPRLPKASKTQAARPQTSKVDQNLFDETEFTDDEMEDPWKLEGDDNLFAGKLQEIEA